MSHIFDNIWKDSPTFMKYNTENGPLPNQNITREMHAREIRGKCIFTLNLLTLKI